MSQAGGKVAENPLFQLSQSVLPSPARCTGRHNTNPGKKTRKTFRAGSGLTVQGGMEGSNEHQRLSDHGLSYRCHSRPRRAGGWHAVVYRSAGRTNVALSCGRDRVGHGSRTVPAGAVGVVASHPLRSSVKPEAIGSGASAAPQLAYAGNVVSFPLRQTFPAMNAVLVLALLLTQAASTMCTAQCVQRQLPQISTHCHSMLHACPHATSATVETGACNSSLCGMDLLAGNQDRSLAQQRPLAVYSDSYDPLPGLDITSLPQASASPRSSFGGPPMITALRV
jgi:hypothetical protein